MVLQIGVQAVYYPSNFGILGRRMFGPEHVFRTRRLYKLILRVHRGLPPELRILGNNYARDEFKRHMNCKPDEAQIFLKEWTGYAINLAKQLKPLNQAKKKTVGVPLDPQMLDYMTEEQLVQLYELHQAASREEEQSEPATQDHESKIDGTGQSK